MTTTAVIPEVEKKEPEQKLARAEKAEKQRKPVAEKAAKSAIKKRKPAARKKAAKKVQKAKRRAFPYLRVAKLWAKGKTIESIARSIGRFEKSADDPLHSMRCFLHRMHSTGYLNADGKRVKLPHRVKKSTLVASRRAGRKAAA
jgi:hypothetical protein